MLAPQAPITSPLPLLIPRETWTKPGRRKTGVHEFFPRPRRGLLAHKKHALARPPLRCGPAGSRCPASVRPVTGDAKLPEARLHRANLSGADLGDARLVGANLTDANLTDAYARSSFRLVETARWPGFGCAAFLLRTGKVGSARRLNFMRKCRTQPSSLPYHQWSSEGIPRSSSRAVSPQMTGLRQGLQVVLDGVSA